MRLVAPLNRSITKLGLTNLGEGRHKLFDGSVHSGIAVKLPGWQYPVVIDHVKGEAFYDNYGGSWGKQIELDKLVQRYTIEVAADQAIAGGYTFAENVLANGDVELEMTAVAST